MFLSRALPPRKVQVAYRGKACQRGEEREDLLKPPSLARLRHFALRQDQSGGRQMRLVGWRRGPPRLAELVAIDKEEVGEAFSHSPTMRETPRDDYCIGPGAVVPSASNQYDPDPNRP